jgi:hypothetical protein
MASILLLRRIQEFNYQFTWVYREALLYYRTKLNYNFLMAEKKVTGPASYFPSIEIY